MPSATIPSPLGPMTVSEAGGAITRLTWGGTGNPGDSRQLTPLLAEAVAQIEAYFAGGLRGFDLPLAPATEPLQAAVRAEMLAIPFGETRTYGEIAKATGAPPQAIGQACGANPIPVIVPCHRVTGTGNLGGFSGTGGVESKVALLRHEGAFSLLI